MTDARRQLTSETWRRIGAVLDRVADAPPEDRDTVLEQACREQGLDAEIVRPFVAAERGSDSLPEEIPPDLIAGPLSDLGGPAAEFRLEPGRTLGPYEIVASLGSGGMGEVYRATDQRLGRRVAIKVLRPHLLDSAAGRDRFDREARAISSLNHPHVCTLHDVGHHDGVDFLVMEHVDGDTLASRLRRGPMPIAQALQFAAQIADALDRAHRAGVVHRDLKPANVMITRAGVKLLDFGLARLEALGPSEIGAVMGTPEYMSPEQLTTGAADARSDIFASGAVLYEMVTGQQAFGSSSRSNVVAAILEQDPPPVARLVPGAPAALEWTISRCLAKDPDDRWQSAADLKHHLDWLAAGRETPPLVHHRRSFAWLAATAMVIAALTGSWAWRQRSPTPAAAAPAVFAIEPPPTTAFALTQALSRDGRRLAFTAERPDGTRELWIRSLDSLTLQRVARSEGAAYPFWSPDGRFVGFFADRRLKTVELASGTVRVICQAGAGGGGTWNDDGVIIFAPHARVSTGLERVSASGGTPVAITTPDEGLHIHAWPHFLPDGGRFLYMRAGNPDPGIYAGRLDSTDPHTLVLPLSSTSSGVTETGDALDEAFGTTKAIVADDTIFFLDHTTLMAQRFDPARLVAVGEPARVADGIDSGSPGLGAFDASAGVVTYRQAASALPAQLTWVDRTGKSTGPLGAPAPHASVTIERDGRFALTNPWAERERAASGTVTRIDLRTGAATPLFTNAASAVLSPDGSRVVFTQLGYGRGPTPMIAALDGSAPARPLADFGGLAHAADWSRDGRFIVGAGQHGETSADIWLVEVAHGGPVRYIVQEPFDQREPRISPDGRWIAYAGTDARGVLDVYVRSLPDGGNVHRISIRGGRSPRWRPDGRELYYVEPGGRLMRVAVSAGPAFAAGTPELLFEHAGLAGEPQAEFLGFPYDVAPDGSRFLIAVPEPDATPRTPTIVILNWTFPRPR